MKTYLIGDKKRLPGFSLIEMLIVVALFSIAITVIAQTFSSFTKLHRKIADQAMLTQDLRFSLELLVRAIRNHPISYATTIQPRNSIIRLQQDGGADLIIRRSSLGEAPCGDAGDVACLLVSADGGVTWSPLTSKHIHVDQFDVYVRPLESPFISTNGAYASDVQPFATIFLRLKDMDPVVRGHEETAEAQTTVSSRVYLR